MESYYSTLGLKTDATKSQINSAYRKLAAKYHPDIVEQRLKIQLNQGEINQAEFNQQKAEAQNKYQEINQAYKVLHNPDAKSHYDTALNADIPKEVLENYRNKLTSMQNIPRQKNPNQTPVIDGYGNFAPLFDWYYNRQ